jgi:hypothetical protein
MYLIFNEGYSATAGDDWMRPDLCAEALRLGRLLAQLAPAEPEVHGLVALMEIQASRIPARTGPPGEPVLLLDQDRTRWDQLLISRGLAALARAEQLGGQDGPYALQAAIAACHARAFRPEDTDWVRITQLYGVLATVQPSPVVELNRVRDELPDRGLAGRRPELRGVPVEAGQHLDLVELGAVVDHRGVQLEVALLHLLQRDHRGRHLGHGHEPEHRVRAPGASSPTARGPTAPWYMTPSRSAAIAATCGTAPESTASRRTSSIPAPSISVLTKCPPLPRAPTPGGVIVRRRHCPSARAARLAPNPTGPLRWARVTPGD